MQTIINMGVNGFNFSLFLLLLKQKEITLKRKYLNNLITIALNLPIYAYDSNLKLNCFKIIFFFVYY
jgi:hypothetical protein